MTNYDPSKTGRSLGAGRALLARKMAVFMAEVRKMTVPARKRGVFVAGNRKRPTRPQKWAKTWPTKREIPQTEYLS